MWKNKWFRWAAQVMALMLVVWGIGHTVRKASQQLTQQKSQLETEARQLEDQARELPASAEASAERDELLTRVNKLRARSRNFWQASPYWLALSGLAYAAGTMCAGWFWRESLVRLAQPAPLGQTLYAYCLGHLGKYFPGKAMVIILRVGVLAPLGVLKVATTLTVFLETLTMMAVGSAWAALCMVWLQLDRRWTLLALGLMAITFLPTLPPLLREVLRRTQRGIEPHLMNAWLARVDWRLLGRGWTAMTITWLANGCSLACILIASPAAEFSGASWLTIAASSLGACAMAVVLGFVSFLPGGAGVREVVLSTMLAPIVGPVAALASAVWLRIVWLATELVLAGLLGWTYRAKKRDALGAGQTERRRL